MLKLRFEINQAYQISGVQCICMHVYHQLTYLMQTVPIMQHLNSYNFIVNYMFKGIVTPLTANVSIIKKKEELLRSCSTIRQFRHCDCLYKYIKYKNLTLL